MVLLEAVVFGQSRSGTGEQSTLRLGKNHKETKTMRSKGKDMKRVKKGGIFRLPMMKLYREDIEELHDLFLSSNSESFEFTVGDFRIEDLNELDKLNEQEYTSFGMTSYSPCVGLTVEPSKAYIYIEDTNDPALLGMKAKIEGIVDKRRSRLSRRTTFFSFLVFGFFTGVMTARIQDDWSGNLAIILTLLLVAAIALVIAFLLMHQTNSRYGVLYLARKREMPGFMARNRDQIIVTLLVGIIVAIVSFLLGFALR